MLKMCARLRLGFRYLIQIFPDPRHARFAPIEAAAMLLEVVNLVRRQTDLLRDLGWILQSRFAHAFLAGVIVRNFQRNQLRTFDHRSLGVALGPSESLTAATSLIRLLESVIPGLSAQNAPIAQCSPFGPCNRPWISLPRRSTESRIR